VEAMMESKVMPSRDILDDGNYLYIVMPFCDGRDFDHYLGTTGKLSENEARRYLLQILEGIETMQNAGVTHRDMSLDNLMIHDGNCIIIDMGVALRIPYENGQRFLIAPQGPCGRWKYMSPEIYRNQFDRFGRVVGTPFDGHAVDLWAVGVILFIMVTGLPPWFRPSADEPGFVHFCRRGRLEQICVHNGFGLSRPLMDLLQRMFNVNPTRRLSLEQIRAHQWTRNEEE